MHQFNSHIGQDGDRREVEVCFDYDREVTLTRITDFTIHPMTGRTYEIELDDIHPDDLWRLEQEAMDEVYRNS